jgi:hypothetical protein
LQHVFGTSASGEHEDGHVILFSPQQGSNVKAAFAREHHVENHGVEALFIGNEALQGGFSVGGDFDGVAFGLQVEPQALGEMRFVFDDQDAAHATLSSLRLEAVRGSRWFLCRRRRFLRRRGRHVYARSNAR